MNKGPVARRRSISASPRLNFNPGSFFFCSKAFSRMIFSIPFRASNSHIVNKKIKLNFAFSTFISEFRCRTNRGLS